MNIVIEKLKKEDLREAINIYDSNHKIKTNYEKLLNIYDKIYNNPAYHNIVAKLNGKIVGSRKVADGKILSLVQYPSKNSSCISYGKYPQYITYNYLNACIKNRDIGNGNYSSVHAITADNPNAYFNGKKWVRIKKENNSRYKKAERESENYIKKAFSKEKKVNSYKKLSL